MVIVTMEAILAIFCRNRIIDKRIHVRIEHVQPSRCREDFFKRIQENKAKRRQAQENKTKIKVRVKIVC